MIGLTEIPGVGESLSHRMIDALGTEEEVLRSLSQGDVASLASVDGVTSVRAIRLIQNFRGEDSDVCKSIETSKLHDRILESIAEYATNNASKERIGLLRPLSSEYISSIESCRKNSKEALDFAFSNPESLETWTKQSQHLGNPKRGTDRIERVIVVPNSEIADMCSSLASRCRVVIRDSTETWSDYTIFPNVTWVGSSGPTTVPPGWICIANVEKLESLVPEIGVEWFELNSTILEAILEIKKIEWPTHPLTEKIRDWVEPLSELDIILESMEECVDLQVLERVKDGIWSEIKAIEGGINDAIVAGTSDAHLSIEGDEVLSFYADSEGLNRRIQATVADTIDEAKEIGRRRLELYLQETGVKIPFDWIESDYPCIISRRAIENIEQELEKGIISAKNNDLIRNARIAETLIEPSKSAISGLIEIEMWLSVARWAVENKCTMPELLSEDYGFDIIEGRHLLLDCAPTPVSYGLGSVAKIDDQQSLALLSGANSGGKTTLLETIAMIALLAHAGLPVPATSAKISLVEEIHILAKVNGTQSAGALERTLMRLAEVFISERRKLVLADELEAITEPGAAARILSGLLFEAMKNDRTTVVLVTHIGGQIRENFNGEIRIDGIEARGLDENLELVVDRTPIRNHLAQSTPELIVRRLAARAEGPASVLFASLSKRFKE